MDGYYHDSDISKAYLVALVLDPRLKLWYFDINWQKGWLIGAREKLEEYMQEFIGLIGVLGSVKDSLSDINMADSQDSNTTFGS